MTKFWQKQQVPTFTTGTTATQSATHSCGCIGPQRGEPYCPCRMRGVIQRDGRWIEPERDLGPVRPHYEIDDLIAGFPTPTDTRGR